MLVVAPIPVALARLLRRWRRRATARRSERLLGALPRHVLKDIGWPGVATERRDGA